MIQREPDPVQMRLGEEAGPAELCPLGCKHRRGIHRPGQGRRVKHGCAMCPCKWTARL